jgi:hypothetical protein
VEDVVNAAKLFGGLGAVAAEGSVMGRRGHTSAAAIAKVERIAAILQLRFAGHTFREIGMMQTPPVSAQAIWKVVWRALTEHPHDPARLRRQAARERAVLYDGT